MATWPTLKVWADILALTHTVPTDPSIDPGDWTEIGSYVQAATISRGASRVDGVPVRYEAGTNTLTLKNTDGRFSPLTAGGPYINVAPRVPYAVQALWSGTYYKLWRGYADAWEMVYPQNGKNAQALLRGTDSFGILANAEANSYAAAAETTGQRINDWRLAVSASILSGITTTGTPLAAATLNGNVLAGMQLVSDTEIGELYVDGAGYLQFRTRSQALTDARSATSQATFDTGATLPFQDVRLSVESDQVRNYISIARAGGTAQVAQDAASIAAYLKRNYTRTDLLHQTDAESADYAAFLLRLMKDPETRIESITLNPQSAPATLFPQVLGRELGDRITVAFTPPGGTAISRECFIRGIQHAIGAGSWSTRWTLQDATRFAYLTFDNATRGRFDFNAFGY